MSRRHCLWDGLPLFSGEPDIWASLDEGIQGQVCTALAVFGLKRDVDLELPTDFSGVAYTPYDDAGQWRLELLRELKAAGYHVDANAII